MPKRSLTSADVNETRVRAERFDNGVFRTFEGLVVDVRPHHALSNIVTVRDTMGREWRIPERGVLEIL